MNRNLFKHTAWLMLPWALVLYGSVAMANPQTRGFQQERGDFRPNRAAYEERHSQMMGQLGLTSEQQAQLKTLREQGKSQGQNLHQQLRTKRQELMQYLKSPNATEAHALELQAEVNALQKRMGIQRIHTWFQMRQILTPEQLRKLEQFKMQRPEFKKSMEGSNTLR